MFKILYISCPIFDIIGIIVLIRTMMIVRLVIGILDNRLT